MVFQVKTTFIIPIKLLMLQKSGIIFKMIITIFYSIARSLLPVLTLSLSFYVTFHLSLCSYPLSRPHGFGRASIIAINCRSRSLMSWFIAIKHYSTCDMCNSFSENDVAQSMCVCVYNMLRARSMRGALCICIHMHSSLCLCGFKLFML